MKSRIEWTESTWNPITGCSKISQGCKHCYAERMAKRLKAMGQHRYRNEFSLTIHEDAFELPLRWKKPQVIFVNSMSDLFHKNVPLEQIQEIFSVMNRASHHQFQVLTKRASRLAAVAHQLQWTENIWIGVSVENESVTNRIDYLRTVPAHIRFLSLEPLLGPLDYLNLEKIHWVILGGESGFKSRPMDIEWCRSIRDQCRAQQVPFFFKQWGGKNKKAAGRMLDNQTWDEMPFYLL